jgi:subtilase family serine protease
VFLPEGIKWLEESAVSTALSSVSGASGASTPGVHGLGLLGTAINGTALVANSTTAASTEEMPEVEVEIQNQGDSTENGVTVSVSVSGTGTLEEGIDSIEPGEIQTVTIPLVPTPSGEKTLEVEVQPVPGEQVTSNNEATYTVEFE